ncbi:MAG: S49 family peptidase [Candidatus Bathyarchaeia archaeon]
MSYYLRGISLGKRIAIVLGLISVILVTGMGYIWYQSAVSGRENLVAVISIDGAIVDQGRVKSYTGMINKAISNDSIKAVVLSIDSPGGYAHYVESIYLDLLRLGEEKPLIATAASALSGGYYITSASPTIYVNPTSMIGNVGVIGTGPPTLVPSESVMESGAHKVTGYSKLLFPFNLTHALDSFASAVKDGRGERLRLDSSELRRGSVYLGSEAVSVGLADGIGSTQRAIDVVTSEAGLDWYRVVDMNALYGEEAGWMLGNNTSTAWRSLDVNSLNELHPPPSLYYLYLPNAPRQFGLYSPGNGESLGGNITGLDARSDVLVDLSHGNQVSSWDLDILMAELALGNKTMGFTSEWDDLRSGLDHSSSLVVAAPTVPYTRDEVSTIIEFVEEGGNLLLFFDPAAGYVEIPSLHGSINSVANNFGISFAKGYLYNQEEHYGFYRNIYVEGFEESNITEGLSRVVMFTSAAIHTEEGLAWSSKDTYSSTAEKAGEYNVLSLGDFNGTVLAIGDITFLKESYCYVEDNYQLVKNIASMMEQSPSPQVDLEPGEEEVLHKPELSAGTEKLFREEVDGETRTVRWYKASETDVIFEMPNRTTHYHLDEGGALLGWESNGVATWYDKPLPESPYPLRTGDEWSYESGYNMTVEDEEYRGDVMGDESVTGFQDVNADNGVTYRCAKIHYYLKDLVNRPSTEITVISSGYTWVSSEAGVVKEESTIMTYVDGVLVEEESRKRMLYSISMG